MRKAIGVKTVEVKRYVNVCDYCGKEFNKDEQYSNYASVEIDYVWEDYGDIFGERKEFCSFKCLIDFLEKELKDKTSMINSVPYDETVKIEFEKEFLGEFLDLVKSSQ